MKNIYFKLFLLSGFFFGLISCTKETETTQPPAVLSPSEANALLARSIQSTEDDVIYLDMTSEQAKKMGITEKLYRDALAQIDTLNKSIRESKEKGITVINGFKDKNTTPLTKYVNSYDPEHYPDHISLNSNILRSKEENSIILDYNPDIVSWADCWVSTNSSINFEPDFSHPNNIYFDVTVECINSGQVCQLVGTAYDPCPRPFRFNSGKYPEVYTSWQFIAILNYSQYTQTWLSFELQKPKPQ